MQKYNVAEELKKGWFYLYKVKLNIIWINFFFTDIFYKDREEWRRPMEGRVIGYCHEIKNTS